jgi:hypothetical protein
MMIDRGVIIGIDSHNYGGGEVLQSGVCKLKNQWCGSVPGLRFENPGKLGTLV